MEEVTLIQAKGYIFKDKIIIPFCPICGKKHKHTNLNNYKVGDKTTRVPHCDYLNPAYIILEYYIGFGIRKINGRLRSYDYLIEICDKDSIKKEYLNFIEYPLSKIGMY